MSRLLTVLVLTLAATAFGQEAGVVRYIVELQGEPAIVAADRAARGAAIAGEQQVFRRALGMVRGARAVAATATVANTVIVEAPAGQLAALASLPGVRRVEQSFDMELHTNRIPAIHRMPAVWEATGGASKAGEGIRIAILDTGVEHSHPAFAAPEMRAPDGYPQGSNAANRALTNGKVIVARSYDGVDARDQVGHGTAVAMVAAGMVHESPRGVIAGMAPGAWIGNYRVNREGTRSIPTDFALQALNNAVDDQMNVINMSFGSNGLTGSASDILAQAARNAAERGIVVVVSAGNSGPEIMTVDDTAAEDQVLAVGANQSDNVRTTPSVLLPEGVPITNVAPSSNAENAQAVSGQLYDIEQFDPTGLLCGGAPPAGSLEGMIPLIQRGECNFTVKLRNAFVAGAKAAILYNSAAPPAGGPDDLFQPDVSTDPTIPAVAIGRTDGLVLKANVRRNEEYQVVIRFFGVANNPYQLAGFSSLGPSVDLKIKPDLVATGENVYTAAQTQFPSVSNSLYNASGYATTQGTSFSAPAVAGAAAALMAARPGLYSADYRSLLVNAAEPLRTSEGRLVGLTRSGAGALNVERSLKGTVTAFPVSLTFGAQDSTVDTWRQVILRNVAGTTATYELSIESDDAVLPQLTDERITLGPDEIAGPVLIFSGGGLAPGAYQGFIRVTDVEHGTVARVPYWMAVRGTEAARIGAPVLPASGRAGTVVTVYLRVHDAAGVPLTGDAPLVTVESGAGVVESFQPSTLYPGTWWLRYRLGPAPGANQVRVTAGGVSRLFSISGTP